MILVLFCALSEFVQIFGNASCNFIRIDLNLITNLVNGQTKLNFIQILANKYVFCALYVALVYSLLLHFLLAVKMRLLYSDSGELR